MRPLEGLSACRLAEATEAVLEPEVVAKVNKNVASASALMAFCS